jgi:hypothetical protein
VELGRAGQQAKAVGVASLENGSDLVFWARSVDGWAGNDPPDNALRVSTYRPEPYRPAPVVAALRARPRSFSLRLSKRAAIEVRFVPDVSHGLTRKTFVRVERAGHRGRNRIVVGKRKLRRLERRAGAGSTVRAIVTATDGRGRQSRAEQVRVVVPG